MTQLFDELVELLEAIEKGGELPPVGPAHQQWVKDQDETEQPDRWRF